LNIFRRDLPSVITCLKFSTALSHRLPLFTVFYNDNQLGTILEIIIHIPQSGQMALVMFNVETAGLLHLGQ